MTTLGAVHCKPCIQPRSKPRLDVMRRLRVTKPTGRLCRHHGTGAMPVASEMPVQVEVSVCHHGLGGRRVGRRGTPAARDTRPLWERSRRRAAVASVCGLTMDPRERRNTLRVAADRGHDEDALREWKEPWSAPVMAQQR
jgi:hypothetical protein